MPWRCAEVAIATGVDVADCYSCTHFNARNGKQEVSEMPRTIERQKSKLAKLVLGRCSFVRETEGGSLVEFALILPCMTLLITGMVWFGIALNNYIVLTNAVGTGARALALARGQTTPSLAGTDPCAFAVQSANAAATILNSSDITYSIDWTTYNASGAAVTSTYSDSCAGLTLNANDTIKIKGVYPFTALIYGWKPTRMNLTAQTAELVQ